MQETDPSPKVGIIDLLERWKEFAVCLNLYPTAEAYTFFGASGGQSFIGKMTAGAAVIFMLTSLALAIFWGQPGSTSVMPEQVAPASAPATMPSQSIPPAAPAEDAK